LVFPNVYGVNRKRPRRKISIIKKVTSIKKIETSVYVAIVQVKNNFTNDFDVMRQGVWEKLEIIVSDPRKMGGYENWTMSTQAAGDVAGRGWCRSGGARAMY